VSSLPGYEVGSALSVLPNVTQNRSCHEKGRSARIYVIIRDGTRSLPNVMFIHFSDLKKDLEGQILKIADFLNIEVDQAKLEVIVAHCSFDYMKANANESVPLGGAFWDGGAKTFIHKGANGRWHDELSPELSARYEDMAVKNLGSACATWLKHGSL
jgi:aryl sulfotransferase